jgi:hypothetical protein
MLPLLSAAAALEESGASRAVTNFSFSLAALTRALDRVARTSGWVVVVVGERVSVLGLELAWAAVACSCCTIRKSIYWNQMPCAIYPAVAV